MKLTGEGILRHRFFGEYSAGIGLRFETAADAALALPKLAPAGLGAQWVHGEGHPEYLVINLDGEQLHRLKQHLGGLGADVEAIDSVEHSVDCGEPFSITVDVEDPRQLTLV